MQDKKQLNIKQTLGPAFPVGPLGPLSPRGPWRQRYGIQMQNSCTFPPSLRRRWGQNLSADFGCQDGHLHTNRGLLTQTYRRSPLSAWARLSWSSLQTKKGHSTKSGAGHLFRSYRQRINGVVRINWQQAGTFTIVPACLQFTISIDVAFK